MKKEGKYYECIGCIKNFIPLQLELKVSCSILANNQESAIKKFKNIIEKNGFLVEDVKVGNPLLDCSIRNTLSINSYQSIRKILIKHLIKQELSKIIKLLKGVFLNGKN